MMNNWPYMKIEDIGEVKSGKRLPKGHSLISEITPNPYIRLVDIYDGKIRKNNIQYLDKASQKKICKYIVETDDVVLAIVGHTIGMVFNVDSEWNKSNLTENAARITNLNEKVFHKFLYYYLLSPYGQQEILSRKVGSAQGKLPLYNIKSLEVPVPPLYEQKAIAHILSVLDDKIELNRQMNESLEAMAQALFKSWFVDFDPVIDNALLAGNAIPDELSERAELRQAQLDSGKANANSEINELFPSEFEFTEDLGWIPKGWEVKKLSEITENIFSGGTPNTKKAEYWDGDLNWFSSGETRESIVIETEKTITEIGVSESSTKLARYGDVLIASAGQGHTRGQTSFCTIDTYFNQSVVCVRPQKSIHYSWLFFNLYGRYEEMRGLSDSHSIRGSLTTKLLSSMSIIKPNENILAKYENIIATHILKIKENKIINNNIAKLRDTLLPKLMSGELRIADAKQLVEDI